MKISPHAQGSVDWSIARAGIPTASEFDNLISPTWKIRTGEMPQTYLAAKLAEAWLGGPLVGFNTFDVEMGNILEEEARPRLSLELEREVDTVGLITTDDGKIGCSPDGLIGEEGVEIKCPAPTAHVKYLLAGQVPPQYLAQVHGGMYVTGFKSWKFFCYRRNFPNLLITVERDEEIISKIDEAVQAFLKSFHDGLAKLEEINGGPPRRKIILPPLPNIQPIKTELVDIIP